MTNGEDHVFILLFIIFGACAFDFAKMFC